MHLPLQQAMDMVVAMAGIIKATAMVITDYITEAMATAMEDTMGVMAMVTATDTMDYITEVMAMVTEAMVMVTAMAIMEATTIRVIVVIIVTVIVIIVTIAIAVITVVIVVTIARTVLMTIITMTIITVITVTTVTTGIALMMTTIIAIQLIQQMAQMVLLLLLPVVLQGPVVVAPVSSFSTTQAARVKVSHQKKIILTPVLQTIMNRHQSLRNQVKTKLCSTVGVVEVEEVVVDLLLAEASVVVALVVEAMIIIDLLLISCMFLWYNNSLITSNILSIMSLPSTTHLLFTTDHLL